MPNQNTPILLYNDECSVCRRIGHWVKKSARRKSGETSIIVQPIGDDPQVLRSLDPQLNIWDAYETIHLLMPDGSMKLGGEAVAEVLRRLPCTKWFAWSFAVRLGRIRPFQKILDLAYTVLSDVRPLFGCESCGTPTFGGRPLARMIRWAKSLSRKSPLPAQHSTPLAATGRRAMAVSGAPVRRR